MLIPAQDGSALMRAVRGAVVAFGVDSLDPRTETGWSVTVIGPSWILRDPQRVPGVAGVGLPGRWSAPGRSLIAVQVGLLRGWRTESDEVLADHDPVPSAR